MFIALDASWLGCGLEGGFWETGNKGEHCVQVTSLETPSFLNYRDFLPVDVGRKSVWVKMMANILEMQRSFNGKCCQNAHGLETF